MTTTASPARGRTNGGRLKKLSPGSGPQTQSTYVPDESWYSSYISRSIQGIQDFDVLDRCLNTARNILLMGPSGPGKTSCFLAWAARNKKPFYSVPSGSSAEISQIFGKWTQNSAGVWQWTDGPAVEIMRRGGCILFNEINFMPAPVMSMAFDMLDRRRQVTLLDRSPAEVVRAHRPPRKNVRGRVVSTCWCDEPGSEECRSKWVLIAADMNPGFLGTRPLNEALENRFSEKLWWDYDPAIEGRLVATRAVIELAEALREGYAQQKFSRQPTTNMLMELEENVIEANVGYAVDCFVNAWPNAERAAVRLIVDTHADDIKMQLNVLKNSNLDGLPDFTTMTEEEIEEWRSHLNPGDVDPELGVLTVDWDWATEEEAD